MKGKDKEKKDQLRECKNSRRIDNRLVVLNEKVESCCSAD